MSDATSPSLTCVECSRHTVLQVIGFTDGKNGAWRRRIPTPRRQLDTALHLMRRCDEVFVFDFDDTLLTWPSEGVEDCRTLAQLVADPRVVSPALDGWKNHVETPRSQPHRSTCGLLVITYGLYGTASCALRARFGDAFFDAHCAVIDRAPFQRPSSLATARHPRWRRLADLLERVLQAGGEDGWAHPASKAHVVRALLTARPCGAAPSRVPMRRVVFADDRPENTAAMLRMLRDAQARGDVETFFVLPSHRLCSGGGDKRVCKPLRRADVIRLQQDVGV